jgi:hypothetical protein
VSYAECHQGVCCNVSIAWEATSRWALEGTTVVAKNKTEAERQWTRNYSGDGVGIKIRAYLSPGITRLACCVIFELSAPRHVLTSKGWCAVAVRHLLLADADEHVDGPSCSESLQAMYGTDMLRFADVSWEAILRDAARRNKGVMVYLHAPDHPVRASRSLSLFGIPLLYT